MLAFLGLGVGQARAGESPQELAFFETRIRPLFAEHCYECHSARASKPKGGLRLDSREGLLKGGDSGPAIVPGDPENSLLIKAIRYSNPDLQMPPKKGKLPDARIDDLVAWVRAGAAWPKEAAAGTAAGGAAFEITDKDREYWAFRPVRRPEPPSVKSRNWVANPIDAFVLAELEAKGVAPNPAASRRELARRVYFDLLGLPPRPSEVSAFVNDPSPETYPKLIDGLLARPEYGERWARHWLDVVRYAQSNGYERDGEKPLAWRYRDYVISAFNEDKPYDRFVQEQIAGDELPDATADSVAATGFQRLGVWDDEPDDKTMAEFDELDDVVSTTGTAFLGLTLGCARCHDHKFDPISQTDYYQFLAFFRNVRPNEDARFSLDSPNYVPLAAPANVRSWVSDRSFHIQALESQIACAVEETGKAKLQQELKTLNAEKPPFEWALAVREAGCKAPVTHVLVRGNPRSPGREVEPAFLTVLGGAKPVLPPPGAYRPSTGRRLALAQWITSRENPLTARVAVNRVWQHHFGQGLVKTPSDFGHAGSGPSHSQLLDWLAAEFMDSGWSLKRLHRLILLSNTYQMSSRNDREQPGSRPTEGNEVNKELPGTAFSLVPSVRTGPASVQAIDPDDQLLWRQRLRRLDSEAVRDSILAVSGELNHAMGGRGFFPHLAGEVLAGESRPGLDWEISSAQELARRSIYIFIRRTMLVPFLEAFDYNNTSSPLAERPVTTVAPQALMLLNSDWTQDRAQAFADRLAREAGTDAQARVRLAYELALGRAPTPDETRVALDFLCRQSQAQDAISSRITFRPDVPNSLFGEYMARLHPTDFLLGPTNGWSYFIGRWSAAYEGIRTVDRQRAPFALWPGQAAADGTLLATILVHPAAESASLLIRSTAEHQEQRGYEVLLDPRRGRVLLKRHLSEVQVVAEAPVSIPSGMPIRLKIEFIAARIRVWLADTGKEFVTEPVLDVIDAKPIFTAGLVGVRSVGAALSVDALTLNTVDGSTPIVPPAGTAGETQTDLAQNAAGVSLEPRAWQSFCLLLLNLNEFVYVD
jgi:mono/diheme cytochrome c family protein